MYLVDKNKDIRKESVNLILQARARERKKKQNQQLENFLKPEKVLNVKATHWFKLIPFKSVDQSYITKPPLTNKFSDDELVQSISGEALVIPPIHLNSQVRF